VTPAKFLEGMILRRVELSSDSARRVELLDYVLRGDATDYVSQ
jgi:hypothetical protein